MLVIWKVNCVFNQEHRQFSERFHILFFSFFLLSVQVLWSHLLEYLKIMTFMRLSPPTLRSASKCFFTENWVQTNKQANKKEWRELWSRLFNLCYIERIASTVMVVVLMCPKRISHDFVCWTEEPGGEHCAAPEPLPMCHFSISLNHWNNSIYLWRIN